VQSVVAIFFSSRGNGASAELTLIPSTAAIYRIYFHIAFFTQPENLDLFCLVKKLFQFLIGAAHLL
jgi:hypothetical protein